MAPIREKDVAPFPCEWEPVLISIDFEAWEKDHSYITEIGVAVLDTRDIAKIPPGARAKNWIEKIRARHFRVKENLNMVNSVHVAGHPDKFKFGESEFLSKSDIREMLVQIIFSPDDEAAPIDNDEVDLVYEEPRCRLFGIIGHSLEADLSFLQKGFNIGTRSSHWCLDTIDTQMMYAHLERYIVGNCSLEGVLQDLGIDYEYLHNAGNDAMYTMQAFIVMALNDSMSLGRAEDRPVD